MTEKLKNQIEGAAIATVICTALFVIYSFYLLFNFEICEIIK